MVDCTFCGDEGVPRGREDVFPRWLAEKLAYFARQHHPDTEATYINYSYERLADLGTPRTLGEQETGRFRLRFTFQMYASHATAAGWGVLKT
jgi:hypothetical protein